MKSIKDISIVLICILCVFSIVWGGFYVINVRNNSMVYIGELRSSSLNDKLNTNWEIKNYLLPYNNNIQPLYGDERQENENEPYVCYFQVEYLGEDKQILDKIVSINIEVDWHRGDPRSYNGKYDAESQILIDENNKVKYFYLPNRYFTPQHIRNLETKMIIFMEDGSKLEYYGNLKC